MLRKLDANTAAGRSNARSHGQPLPPNSCTLRVLEFCLRRFRETQLPIDTPQTVVIPVPGKAEAKRRSSDISAETVLTRDILPVTADR